MRRASAAVLLAVSCLANCEPTLRQPAQQFAATTSLEGESVIVSVTNLGPADLWLDSNHCPRLFRVGVQEGLPSTRTLIGRDLVNIGPHDVCTMELRPPERWKVGETKAGALPHTRLPSGTHTVTAWAEPKVAPDVAGKLGEFRTVRVPAPSVVLTVP